MAMKNIAIEKLTFFVDDINNIDTIELSDFISKIDKELIDPIYLRSYFGSYDALAKKFINKSRLIYCKNESNLLIAAAALYADSALFDFGYEAFVGVVKEFTGLGIGKGLMRREIELVKYLGMRGLMTNCHKENIAKVQLNLKMGYTEVTDKKMLDFLLNMNYKWNGKRFFMLKF